VAKLSADGSSLIWATYLVGNDVEYGTAIVLDAAGNALVAGDTGSVDFPTTPGAYEPSLSGIMDAFETRLSDDGSRLIYSTFLGGDDLESAYAVAQDSFGDAAVAGVTYSANFPVMPFTYDGTFNGVRDAFVVKLWLLHAPTIDITSPLGGEVWIQGSSHAVTWRVADQEDLPTDLLVWINYTSSAGGGSICGPVAGNVGSCDWTLPSITADDVVVDGVVFDTDGLSGRTQTDPFTIAPPQNTPPAIVVVYPSGGEVFYWGDAPTVTWTGSDAQDPPSSLTFWINYSSSAGNGVICGPLIGIYSCGWTLPAITATDVVVNGTAIDTGGLKGYGESGQFAIGPPPNTAPIMGITSPSGGEVWTQGSSHSVTWTASDNEDAPSSLLVWINYASGAGSGSICGPIAGDVGSCYWTLPSITATDVVVDGTAIDTGSLSGYGESGPFTIQAPPNTAPTIAITSPSGGEVWTSGTTHTIAWTAYDNEDAPSALLVWVNYTSGAESGTIYGPGPGGLGTRSWVIPILATTTIVFNGTVVDTGGLRGYDESAVTVQAPPNTPPMVNITSPTGGEELLKGSLHTIRWTMQDDEDVEADLTVYVNYTTGGAAGQIVAALKGETSFDWTLPDIEADDIVVNITVIDTGGLKGWSQSGPFTIKASSPPDFFSQYWWLVVVILAVVTVLLLLALMKRRKPKEEESPEAAASLPSESPR